MEEILLDQIKKARQRIQKIVPPTPVKRSVFLENRLGFYSYLKLENLNISGSFKIRGAANALLQLPAKELEKGVVCASAGNHAQGIAHICRTLNARAEIFMPQNTPLVKVESTRNLGGMVHLGGDSYEEAFQAATNHHNQHGGVFVHAFADAAVIGGQGSIGLELLEQIPNVGLVVVPIGGGGLIGGIACALKETRPDIIVIGVETSQYPAMKRSIEAGRIVATETKPSIADGIAVKKVAQLTFDLTKKYVDEIILVEEEAIASAIMMLMERDHILAEGAGAVSVAALLQLDEKWLKNLGSKSIACVISGGNIDVNLLTRITTKGLIFSGRMMRIRTRIKDKPGNLAKLLNLIGETGANLIEVNHNRLYSTYHYDEVEVQIDLETTNLDHQNRIKETLSGAGFSVGI